MMKKSTQLKLLIASVLLSLSACNAKTDHAVASASKSETVTDTTFTTDNWLGRWNGPEGTFIEITGGEGNYMITIQDLDGPKQYQGASSDEKISFQRNGTTELIEASSGVDTGMKWLSEKSNCLRVSDGEGWCRD